MNIPAIIKTLQKNNLLSGSKIETVPLKGGVSSEIFLVTDGTNRFVIKKARKKLKVKDDWYSDTQRNRVERQFMEVIQKILPGTVPEIVLSGDRLDYFVMEYLDPVSFKNWKDLLMAGTFDNETTMNAAVMLADLHRLTCNSIEARELFRNKRYFINLRTEPYLKTTAERHPEFNEEFLEEADRLDRWEESLIHGDFSPKNILVSKQRLVLLDHEVACFGDPAFDLAFMLTHLHLKMLWCQTKMKPFQNLPPLFWKSYSERAGSVSFNSAIGRTGKLLLMLMLARIDGKSPVEYLNEAEQEFVRNFVFDHLRKKKFNLEAINMNWNRKLQTGIF